MENAKTKRPKMERYTIKDFQSEFGTDDACLEWLKNHLYPNGIFCETCQRITKHHKVVSRRSYSCDHCGHHVHPTADTIYHKSTTPLRLWFYAIYLMASSRCGISAKHLERELGVTYKTAWRMFKQIRSMLANDSAQPLSGQVEVDETYMGGVRRGGKRGRGSENKTVVIGAAQRGGKVIAVKANNVKSVTVIPFIKEFILPDSIVYTDELPSYNAVPKHGYDHRRIHHASKIYVVGDIHTSNIEGFWSLIKRSIGGAHHSVSDKYLQSYLNEYSFRHNRRFDVKPMFRSFLEQAQKD